MFKKLSPVFAAILALALAVAACGFQTTPVITAETLTPTSIPIETTQVPATQAPTLEVAIEISTLPPENPETVIVVETPEISQAIANRENLAIIFDEGWRPFIVEMEKLQGGIKTMGISVSSSDGKFFAYTARGLRLVVYYSAEKHEYYGWIVKEADVITTHIRGKNNPQLFVCSEVGCPNGSHAVVDNSGSTAPKPLSVILENLDNDEDVMKQVDRGMLEQLCFQHGGFLYSEPHWCNVKP